MQQSFAVVVILVPVFLLAAFSAQVRAQTPVAIRNVTLIDMTGGQPRPNMTVVIKGDRIDSIGQNVRITKNADVIDGTGKFLIPGLWDMHVHIFNNVSAPGTNNKDAYFPLLITNGVTGVRDTFTDADDIRTLRSWRADIEARKMIGPRVVAGSSIIDGVPVLQPNSLGVAADVEARNAVRSSKASGSAFIKVYENLSRESYYAIADEAKKLKVPFIGHVPYTLTPQEASNAGQKSIEHLTRMTIACSSKEGEFKDIKNHEWTPELRTALMESFSEQKCREVAKLFVRNQTWHDPTMVESVSRLLGDDEKLAADDRLRYVSRDTRDEWLKYSKGFSQANRKMRESNFQRWLEILNIMHKAGVPILAGTDVGNAYVYAGSSLHDELAFFVRAGMTPLEALRTATVNPAKFLGMERSHGTVEKGKIADLVMLDANPLSDITNTKKIQAVIANGRLLRRTEIDAMLQAVEASFKGK